LSVDHDQIADRDRRRVDVLARHVHRLEGDPCPRYVGQRAARRQLVPFADGHGQKQWLGQEEQRVQGLVEAEDHGEVTAHDVDALMDLEPDWVAPLSLLVDQEGEVDLTVERVAANLVDLTFVGERGLSGGWAREHASEKG